VFTIVYAKHDDLKQTCATTARRVVWCGPRGFVYDLEMVFQINYIPQFFVLLISQSFTTSFCTYQRFAALEVHEQRTVTFFNYRGIIDHEANINICAICNCYATAQIQLFVM